MAYDPLTFGTQGNLPGYDSNQENSAVNTYNSVLQTFTPGQLLQRYSQNWDGRGQGTWDDNYSNAYKSFVSQIGRAPSESEFAQLLPAFQQGTLYGNAIIGSMRDRLAQDPNDPINAGKASQFSGQVNNVFKSMIGRDATAEEASHFGRLMATGNVDAYQLQDFLRGTPEYQGQQDTQFRTGLSKELEDSDVRYFDRAKQSVLSKFMQQGTAGSSALDSALADLMGQIAEKRSGFLSQVSSNQYGANKDLALGNYANARDEYFNNRDYNRGMTTRNSDYYRGRADDLYDYQRKMDDYARMNKRDDTLHTGDWINLGLGAANTGAKIYGSMAGGGGSPGGGFEPYSGMPGPYSYGR